MRIKMTCHGKYVKQHVSHFFILYLFAIKFFIKETSEMNIKMHVIFIHEKSNYDAFIQEANIVMKK
jgi:hypothetical protein